jgi:simple sugar transport system permease protein
MDILYVILQSMFVAMTPLLVVALGGLFSERSGIVNIALEGLMIIGAFVSSVVLFNFINIIPTQLLYVIAMLISGLVAMLISLMHAYASISLKANQIISATAINLLAAPLAAVLIKAVRRVDSTWIEWGGKTFIVREIPFFSQIPIIGDIFFRNFFISFYIGIVILIVSWIILNKTVFGLRLRSCGENPNAAASLGIDVNKMRYYGVMISGFLSGVGGSIFLISVNTTSFRADPFAVSGFGFLALAVLIFGNWNPWKILFAAFFFAFFRTIDANFSILNNLLNNIIPVVYRNLFKLVPYVATIVALALTSKNSKAPKAAGKIYDQGER